jgi:protein-L-isoaspartate O-methyltransferase
LRRYDWRVVANGSDPIEQFLLITERSILEGTFTKAVLAKPRSGTDVERVTVRLVAVRGENVLSCVYSYAAKDVTKNIPIADGRATLRGLLQGSFLRGHLLSATENIDLSISKKGKAVMHQVKVTAPTNAPTNAPTTAPADVSANTSPNADIQAVSKEGTIRDSSSGLIASDVSNQAAAPIRLSVDEVQSARRAQPWSAQRTLGERREGIAAKPSRVEEPEVVNDANLSAMAIAAQAHDRVKQRFVDVNRKYLVDLGVTLEDGRVVPAMARKWKQINKFVETLDGALTTSALRKSDSVRVVDFGAGRGYLTFALHDHLRNTLGKSATVTGVELREPLVVEANQIALQNNADGLQFVCGDIATVATEGSVDVMVALHACDVATDMAIHRGIRAGAAIIVCSPCCHKDVRRQMQMPEVLQPMLQFGVHMGQEADMVTDTIRALLLEASGYDTKVFEFVGLEHSGKNKMILGVARTQPDVARAEKALQQVAALKKFYSISHQRLETLLNGTGNG